MFIFVIFHLPALNHIRPLKTKRLFLVVTFLYTACHTLARSLARSPAHSLSVEVKSERRAEACFRCQHEWNVSLKVYAPGQWHTSPIIMGKHTHKTINTPNQQTANAIVIFKFGLVLGHLEQPEPRSSTYSHTQCIPRPSQWTLHPNIRNIYRK